MKIELVWVVMFMYPWNEMSKIQDTICIYLLMI